MISASSWSWLRKSDGHHWHDRGEDAFRGDDLTELGERINGPRAESPRPGGLRRGEREIK